MSGPVWYYAQGDTEKGPLTTAQMKALAAAGKIGRDDFVWRQGMETWSPAHDVSDLFPDSVERNNAAAPNAVPKYAASRVQPDSGARSQFVPLGQTLLAAGLLTVLLVRGCDSLAVRNVQRLQAIPTAIESRFQEEWDRERQRIEAEVQAAELDPPSSGLTADALRQKLVQLDEANRSQMEQLEAGSWRQLRSTAQAAETENLIWGFWRESAFLVGSISLAFGLLLVAFATQGPDRWLCLGMLSAIVISVFLANPWL